MSQNGFVNGQILQPKHRTVSLSGAPSMKVRNRTKANYVPQKFDLGSAG
jgi:hypothetical protein